MKIFITRIHGLTYGCAMCDVFASNVPKIRQIIPNSECIHVCYVLVRSENMIKFQCVFVCVGLSNKLNEWTNERMSESVIPKCVNFQNRKTYEQMWIQCKIDVEMRMRMRMRRRDGRNIEMAEWMRDGQYNAEHGKYTHKIISTSWNKK